MFTSFKELEAYVLGCGMKKRIALPTMNRR